MQYWRPYIQSNELVHCLVASHQIDLIKRDSLTIVKSLLSKDID